MNESVSPGKDPLRMLRAIRFVSTLGFSIARSTKGAIEGFACSIHSVHVNRISSELDCMLMGDNVCRALKLLFELNLLGHVLPEVYPITMYNRETISPSKDIWEHTIQVVSQCPKELRWAALLHDIGKPQTRTEHFSVHYLGHHDVGAMLANTIMTRLNLRDRKKIVQIVKFHHRFDALVTKEGPSLNGIRRLMKECEENNIDIKDLLSLYEADCTSLKHLHLQNHQNKVNILRKALDDIEKLNLQPKLPSGIGYKIVDRMCLAPGPEVGEIKGKLFEMLLSNKINLEMSLDEMIDCYIKEKK